ncbi:Bcr/CflA family multidrug efflux MFS transporter [Roseomonas sp. E05]|uniref:Bcr/CflA family multidrug efflux MFS transporter n=1 Tax=Roseomonas sp. E05 TaxID=3046310 RepID=UPI0024B97731|nr:Bcr/CflA family multidrug efflux MFS transporter [Roseomonas sp. E05]MDJ0389482.1 Bcr/CflA family multidrug efflux MFS transporter [Roseomonas sp. E05]
MTDSIAPVQASRSRGRLELILILGSLTAFAPLATDMYLPALPAIQQTLATSPAAVQGTLAAFFLAFALGQAAHGPLSDRFGRRPPLFAGLLLFVAASFGCAVTGTVEWLILLRFLQGLGASAGMVIARAVVRDRFPPQEGASLLSTLMLVSGVAPMLAPLLGGALLQGFGWRAIFWVLAGFGTLALGLALLRLPETHPPQPDRPLRFTSVLRGYLALATDRRFIWPALTGSLSIAGMFAYITGSPFVFIELLGVPAEHFGWIFGANAMGLILAAQVNARLVRRLSTARVMGAAAWVQSLAGLALLVLAAIGGGFWALLPPLFLFLACVGFIMPNSVAIAMMPFGDRAGAASALIGVLQFVLAAIAATAVASWHAASGVPMALPIAVCGLASLVVQQGLLHRKAA